MRNRDFLLWVERMLEGHRALEKGMTRYEVGQFLNSVQEQLAADFQPTPLPPNWNCYGGKPTKASPPLDGLVSFRDVVEVLKGFENRISALEGGGLFMPIQDRPSK